MKMKMKKRKVFNNDYERIDGMMNKKEVFNWKLLSTNDITSLKLLKEACEQRHLDTKNFLYKSDYENGLNNAEKYECAICLEEYNLNDKIIRLDCKHVFHFECLKKAVYYEYERTQRIPTCSTCRKPLF